MSPESEVSEARYQVFTPIMIIANIIVQDNQISTILQMVDVKTWLLVINVVIFFRNWCSLVLYS